MVRLLLMHNADPLHAPPIATSSLHAATGVQVSRCFSNFPRYAGWGWPMYNWVAMIVQSLAHGRLTIKQPQCECSVWELRNLSGLNQWWCPFGTDWWLFLLIPYHFLDAVHDLLTVIHFFFGSIQFSVKRNLPFRYRENFGGVTGIQTILR